VATNGSASVGIAVPIFAESSFYIILLAPFTHIQYNRHFKMSLRSLVCKRGSEDWLESV